MQDISSTNFWITIPERLSNKATWTNWIKKSKKEWTFNERGIKQIKKHHLNQGKKNDPNIFFPDKSKAKQ